MGGVSWKLIGLGLFHTSKEKRGYDRGIKGVCGRWNYEEFPPLVEVAS